jgi:hypothetical protein
MTQNRDLQKLALIFSWPCVAAATNRDKRSHLVIDDVSASSYVRTTGIIFPLGEGGWEMMAGWLGAANPVPGCIFSPLY